MSGNLSLRLATIDDAPELVEFNRAMARETEDIDLDPDTVTAGVRGLFGNPERGFYVVAESGGRLAGALMITYEWSDWRDGMFWWIQSVYVRPECRRRGVYRSLYEFVLDLADARSEVCGLRLYVERDNQRAQRTYRSLGMSPTPYLVYEALTRRKGSGGGVKGLDVVAAPGLGDVKRLLDGAGLPSSDVDDALLEHFWAGRSNDILVGVVGLEPCGRAGLLRSLVVEPGARGAGVGRALVNEAERRAGALGIEILYLLTTDADAWFRRLGYSDCDRDAAPPAIRQSREFADLCPGDAAFLCKRLASD